MISENEFRLNFGRKLHALRKRKGLTQQELANELNYTDKAISKWERGESIPDSYTLYVIADFFAVSIDDLISDQEKISAGLSVDPKERTSTKLFVPMIVSVGIFFIASIFFLVMKNVSAWSDYAYYSFLYAVPVAAIVLTVFSSIWWKIFYRCISVSLVIWSIGFAIYFSLQMENLKYIFIPCALLQAACILIYLFAYFLSKKSKSL
ncbi:MAG: helix-turn-helix domain-containing protein [Acutalibacteraceae bacterium]